MKRQIRGQAKEEKKMREERDERKVTGKRRVRRETGVEEDR